METAILLGKFPREVDHEPADDITDIWVVQSAKAQAQRTEDQRREMQAELQRLAAQQAQR